MKSFQRTNFCIDGATEKKNYLARLVRFLHITSHYNHLRPFVVPYWLAETSKS